MGTESRFLYLSRRFNGNQCWVSLLFTQPTSQLYLNCQFNGNQCWVSLLSTQLTFTVALIKIVGWVK